MKNSLLFIALASFTLGINAADRLAVNVLAEIQLPASMELQRKYFKIFDNAQSLQKSASKLDLPPEQTTLGNLQPASIPEANERLKRLNILIFKALKDRPLIIEHLLAENDESLEPLTEKQDILFMFAQYALRAKIVTKNNLMRRIMRH